MESAQARLREAINELTQCNPGSPEWEQAQNRLNEAREGIRQAGETMRSGMSRGTPGPQTWGAPNMPSTKTPGGFSMPPRDSVRPPTGAGEIVCCPECLRTNKSNNTTKPLNRKQRRAEPVSHGFRLHESAYCVHCNERMVYMPVQEHFHKRMGKIGVV